MTVEETAALKEKSMGNHWKSSLFALPLSLIYVVCTLTRAETIDVAHRFENAFPQFQPLSLANPFLPNAPASNHVWIWPQDNGGNGMFICAWRRENRVDPKGETLTC